MSFKVRLSLSFLDIHQLLSEVFIPIYTLPSKLLESQCFYTFAIACLWVYCQTFKLSPISQVWNSLCIWLQVSLKMLFYKHFDYSIYYACPFTFFAQFLKIHLSFSEAFIFMFQLVVCFDNILSN